MKKPQDILGVEIHIYAPELNTLVFKDYTEHPCPNIVDPERAYEHYKKTS